MVQARTDQVIEFENYLKSLPTDNRNLVKNIFEYDIDKLMEFDFDKFNSLLQNSMSAKQLGELSTEDFDYRVKLVEDIFKLWCIAKVTLITHGNGNGKKKNTGHKSGSNKKESNNKDELESETTFKFSDNGKRMLVESIILEDTPMFIGYSNQKDKIRSHRYHYLIGYLCLLHAKNTRINHMNLSLDESNSYLDIAKNQTIDTLYEEIKSIVRLFNNQEDNKLNWNWVFNDVVQPSVSADLKKWSTSGKTSAKVVKEIRQNNHTLEITREGTGNNTKYHIRVVKGK
jgi:hypothetical protein